MLLIIINKFKTEVTSDFPIWEIILDCIYAKGEKLTVELEHLWLKYEGRLNRLQVKTSQVL